MVKHSEVKPTAVRPVEADITRQAPVRITLSAHRHMSLRPITDYFFASSATTTEIVTAELAQAALSYPLAFVVRDGGIALVALLALNPGQNLFVSESGSWLSDFVPSSICTYPFQFRATEPGGRAALLADANSGLIGIGTGEPLFTEEGKPSEKTKSIVHTLKLLEKSRKATRAACEQLLRYKLLVPWAPGSTVGPLRELFRVDENSFNRLPQGIFLLLRQACVLPIVYSHLLSLALLPRLAAMARICTAAEQKRRRLLNSCFSMDEGLPDTIPF